MQKSMQQWLPTGRYHNQISPLMLDDLMDDSRWLSPFRDALRTQALKRFRGELPQTAIFNV
jgi:hypothetical protein